MNTKQTETQTDTAATEPKAKPRAKKVTRAPAKPKAVAVGARSPRASKATTGNTSGKTRDGTKQAILVELLKRPEGTTIKEMMKATGWLSHTVRGAMAGALKKRLGLRIEGEKIEGRAGYIALATETGGGRRRAMARRLFWGLLEAWNCLAPARANLC